MALTVYAGETLTVTAHDLTHSVDGPVVAGAVVGVEVLDAAGTIVGTATGSNGGSGDDWTASLAAPNTAGDYTVRATATVTGAVWKAKEPLIVKTF